MTMNATVFRAILAMDSYNRGYAPSINGVTGTSIGLANVVSNQALNISDAQYQIWQSAGFYASAYVWNGQNVISYRGTNPDFSGSVTQFYNSPGFADVFHGWSLGAGFAGADQGQLALAFYQAVAGVSSPYYLIDNSAASTMLLGHSLGGGLAGFVGALSGEVAYGYDHMPFGMAAYAQAISDSAIAATAVITSGFATALVTVKNVLKEACKPALQIQSTC
jgi:hypothetical protein